MEMLTVVAPSSNICGGLCTRLLYPTRLARDENTGHAQGEIADALRAEADRAQHIWNIFELNYSALIIKHSVREFDQERFDDDAAIRLMPYISAYPPFCEHEFHASCLAALYANRRLECPVCHVPYTVDICSRQASAPPF